MSANLLFLTHSLKLALKPQTIHSVLSNQIRGRANADPRLDALAEIVKPERILPTTMEFVDIAGLVAGASKGEGLGNKFLANIRETDAIGHVVRCFENDDIVHVAGKIDPLDDIDTINTELALADLDSCERAIQRLQKRAKGGDKEAKFELSVMEKILLCLKMQE